MAATTFHVQHVLDNPQSFSHHESISQLWESKWRAPCSKGVYPFEHGNVEDFEPIFDLMIHQTGNLTNVLSEPDKYAGFFLPVGDQLFRQAEAAEKAGHVDQAQDLFLRASAVYRIARFPVNRPDSPLNWKAWEEGKAAYLRGSRYFQSPVHEVAIPFDLADVGAGDAGRPIQTYLRVPQQRQSPPSSGWPTLLLICGLDAYRTDNTEVIDKHLQDGFAVLCLEIPGTGDCPASRNDPTSPDRLFGTVLNWIAAEGYQEWRLDSSRVFVRGISTGGYYALRLAHTHAVLLRGAVAQGGWSHYALSSSWLRKSNNGEYPFGIADGFTYKLGYASIETALEDDIMSKFSLLESGVLNLFCCPTLLVNGWEDSIFPVEDTLLAASYGRPKCVRLVEGCGHMGRPDGDEEIKSWLREALAATSLVCSSR